MKTRPKRRSWLGRAFRTTSLLAIGVAAVAAALPTLRERIGSRGSSRTGDREMYGSGMGTTGMTGGTMGTATMERTESGWSGATATTMTGTMRESQTSAYPPTVEGMSGQTGGVPKDMQRQTWKESLERFSDQNLHRIAMLEIDEDGGRKTIAEGKPLMGVTYESEEISPVVRVMLGEQPGEHTSHVINDPTAVRLLVARDGTTEGLEVDSGQGKTYLHFQ